MGHKQYWGVLNVVCDIQQLIVTVGIERLLCGRPLTHMYGKKQTQPVGCRSWLVLITPPFSQIAMISPGFNSCEHTLNTSRYADRYTYNVLRTYYLSSIVYQKRGGVFSAVYVYYCIRRTWVSQSVINSHATICLNLYFVCLVSTTNIEKWKERGKEILAFPVAKLSNYNAPTTT